MGRGRTLLFGGVAGAALGVALAPRLGEPRRVALQRLRLALRPGRGSLGAFAGTPCSTAARASAKAESGPADLK
jgi:hypothetical protein